MMLAADLFRAAPVTNSANPSYSKHPRSTTATDSRRERCDENGRNIRTAHTAPTQTGVPWGQPVIRARKAERSAGCHHPSMHEVLLASHAAGRSISRRPRLPATGARKNRQPGRHCQSDDCPEQVLDCLRSHGSGRIGMSPCDRAPAPLHTAACVADPCGERPTSLLSSHDFSPPPLQTPSFRHPFTSH